MVSQSVTKKGFTLLETMLVLSIIVILTALSTFKFNPISLNQFENEYLLTQLKALSQNKTYVLNHHESSNVSFLSFNHFGNVNQAQTIVIKNRIFTVQLGSGRYVYE